MKQMQPTRGDGVPRAPEGEHLQQRRPALPEPSTPCADGPADSSQPPFLTLRFPAYLPPGLNGPKGLLRMHWRARQRANEAARMLVRSALGPPPHPSTDRAVRVLMVRTRTRGPQMDEDNARASFKVLGDALEALGIVADDKQIAVLDVEQRRGPMKQTEVALWVIE